jgi:Eukaryotic translation initiation factor 3 subunit 8 N-terminus
MDRFSNFICSNEKRESICIRALLYQVYHLALHDKWDEAVAVMEQFRLQVNLFVSSLSSWILKLSIALGQSSPFWTTNQSSI